MRRLLLMATLALATALPVLAETPNPIQRNNLNSVWFENWIGLSNASLKVSAPNGNIETIYEKSRSPVYRLSGVRILDGVYRYELRADTDELIPAEPNRVTIGEEVLPDKVPKPFYMVGVFSVERGVIIAPDVVESD